MRNGKRRPFTLNEHYFIQCKADKHTQLVNIRRQAQRNPGPETSFPIIPALNRQAIPLSTNNRHIDEQELLIQLGRLGYKIKFLDQLARLHDPDIYEAELRPISSVLAYVKFAYKRMIDTIPMRIEHHLVHGFAERVRDRLITELGLVGEGGLQKCKMLATDNPEIEGRREDLPS